MTRAPAAVVSPRSTPHQFSGSVAGRTLDAARCRRLRPERGAGTVARGGGLSRADRSNVLRSWARAPSNRASEAGRSRSSSPPNSTIRMPQPSSKSFCCRAASKFIAHWSRSAPTANRIRRAATSSCWRSRIARTSKHCSNVRITRPYRVGPPRPYDVAGWTLPAQMGVDVRTIERTIRNAEHEAPRCSVGESRSNRRQPQARPLPHRCARKRWRSRYQPVADGRDQAEVALPGIPRQRTRVCSRLGGRRGLENCARAC